MNCKPIDLLLLTNVTHGINLAVASLRLPPGSEILMTDHEYGAMIYCWKKFAAERGWRIRTVTIPYASENPSDFVAAFDAAIAQESKALFFSHVTSTTGLVLPAAELCALARRRGLVSVVDGAHAPGMVPLNLTKIDADYYGANCHKWIMAPMGAGFLCVRGEHQANIEPQVISWGWGYPSAERNEDSGVSGAKWQYALEFYGCTERCPQMVLPETLDFRESLGGETAIANRTCELALYTRERLAALGYVTTPLNPGTVRRAHRRSNFQKWTQSKCETASGTNTASNARSTSRRADFFLRVSSGVVCHAKEEIDCLAGGVEGDGGDDWRVNYKARCSIMVFPTQSHECGNQLPR